MLNLPRFTFLNGPAGSGKSTLATMICATHKDVWRDAFAEPIRQMVYTVFFPEEGPIFYDLDLREGEVKKKPFPFQYPDAEMKMSFREVMISFSEDWMKLKFGKDIFGRLAFRRCVEQELFSSRFLFDDCGFTDEAMHIVKMASPAECLLIRLHREGCDFHGDSRGYIILPEIRTLDLHNNLTPEDMLSYLELQIGAI